MKKFKILILLLCLAIPACFFGCENKNKSTLATPNIVNISGGTIIFDPVADAEYYTISINHNEFSVDTRFSNNVEIIDNKINYDASKIFVIGESYTVKVRANSSKQNNSSFSTPFSYRHSGSIEKPENVKINATTLTWDVVENASYYLVKIVTPNDTILLDKQGNVLPSNDAENIAKADLTEYSFNTNQFDFGSLLAKAGKYEFYVCAVLSDGLSYTESSYTSKVSYTHYVTLSAPTNGIVKKIGNQFHLSTVLDPNANAISISVGEFEKTAEINGSEQSIDLINGNYLDINLNEYFKDLINSNKLNFEAINQFSFKTQSKYISNTPGLSFYVNSEYSNYVAFENTYKLSAPVLEIEHSNANNCYIAKWSCQDKTLIGEYKLYVYSTEGLKEYRLNNTTESMLIDLNFTSICIRAIGVGNYISSSLSNVVSNPTLSSAVSNISITLTDSVLSWNSVAEATYIVEIEDKVFTTTTNSYSLIMSELTNKNFNVSVTALKQGLKHKTTTKSFSYTEKLTTPTIAFDQGFNSKNIYELTFTGGKNAIGYYIYIKGANSDSYTKIDTLYTSTTIDLSKYITTEGEYTDYEVKIQAVADMFSNYEDSALSIPVSVSHIKVLSSPDFYQINNIDTPISKQISGDSIKYMLKFYGVSEAASYEVLINYNKITVPAKNLTFTGIYEIDVSNYLISANNYEIKIRSIPSSSAYNVHPSEYAVSNYALTKQLPTVENIVVNENEGVYSLSFGPVDNAESYRVRIIKENDASYVDYLNELGLTNSLVVTQSTDVSAYLMQKGVYYFYVTALAPKTNSYYADASESTTYGYVNKLQSLISPTNITFVNSSKDSYIVNWIGDEHADYYFIKLTDPNNISYEFRSYTTSCNINEYMTIQGDYTIAIYSMVNAIGENAKEYASSSATTKHERYIYNYQQDFERYAIYMYGENYDFAINTVEDLKNLLWYHYLYEINITTGLKFVLNPDPNNTEESLRETILRLVVEAEDLLLHKFSADEQWLKLIEEDASDNMIFSYLCKQLLNIYPEFNILENFNLERIDRIFMLTYSNALNAEKTAPSKYAYANTNYGNNYTYIDAFSRKSSTGVFKIDTRKEMLVTTTEQLLQAVQHNRKPKFIGENSYIAESVYNNAKLVLSAIVTNNMSDTEKVTEIFDWLESNFDLTYYNLMEIAHISGSVEKASLETYGLSKIYYLEGIFQDISMLSNGDIVIGNKYATSQSYSKAFALLCAIEGIDATVVNGKYTYKLSGATETIVDHAWNKVLLDTSIEGSGKKWYSVDITFSDNRIYFYGLKDGYGMSSHTYFLTTDTFAESHLNKVDEMNIISSSYKEARVCDTSYNYYANASFKLTFDQIRTTISDFIIYEEDPDTHQSIITTTGFEYLKEYDTNETYQQYAKTLGYGSLQNFLLNSMIYCEYMADTNGTNKSVFEFKLKIKDNGGLSSFDIKKIASIFDEAPNKYNLKLQLVNDPNGSLYTVVDEVEGTISIVYIVAKV